MRAIRATRWAAPGLLLAALLLSGCTSTPDDGPDGGGEGPAAPAVPPDPRGVVDGTVNTALLGTHVGLIGRGGQPLPPSAGGLRLWDSSATWRDIEKVQGQVDWAPLDTAVAEAERMGAQEIVWVHGTPPPWAARNPEAAGIYGVGTSSPPRRGPYLDILRQVTERYKGRITAYQVWNEANINIFYRGKADYLAELTALAKGVVDEIDPDALVIGASSTVRGKGPVKKFYGLYTEGLAQRGWPVDAMSVHLYPRADEGPDERVDYIRLIKSWLADRGWTGPLWDTEINYGDRRSFAPEKVVIPQETAVAWVARTYLDSLALGVDRVYWYTWNDHSLGIDQIDAETSETLPAGQSFLTVQEWLRGAAWEGCTGELVKPTGDKGAVTTCSLTTADGVPAQILYTLSGSAEVDLPEGATSVCRLDGTCADVSGDSLKVTKEPVLVKLG